MEAAYGLSITVTMLMTTFLLMFYLLKKGAPRIAAYMITLFFGSIEMVFFVSSIAKFFHGGYVAVGIALLILAVMTVWELGNIIKDKTSDTVPLRPYIDQLRILKEDREVPIFQTNVIFMTSYMIGDEIERKIIYSILDKRPKRANVYWFINVTVTDDPFTEQYSVDMMGTDFIVQVQLYLGFRVSQEVNVYLRKIVIDLMKDGRLPTQPQKYSLTPGRQVGDFKFIIIREELSKVTELKKWERHIMQLKLAIKKRTTAPEHWFGLQFSEVKYESVPLFIGDTREINLVEKKK